MTARRNTPPTIVADRAPTNNGANAYYYFSANTSTGACPLIVNGVSTEPIPWDATPEDVLDAIVEAVPALAGVVQVVID